jgi:hypothetical protein
VFLPYYQRGAATIPKISLSETTLSANRHADALAYLSAMLEMYETVQCQTDKESIRPIIDPRLRYELESIDLSIKNSNNMIGFTRSGGEGGILPPAYYGR